jgi:hypothetical protein
MSRAFFKLTAMQNVSLDTCHLIGVRWHLPYCVVDISPDICHLTTASHSSTPPLLPHRCTLIPYTLLVIPSSSSSVIPSSPSRHFARFLSTFVGEPWHNHIYVHVCIHIHSHTFIHVFFHTYIHIHICIYTHFYIHI